jgi:hypothetical protein
MHGTTIKINNALVVQVIQIHAIKLGGEVHKDRSASTGAFSLNGYDSSYIMSAKKAVLEVPTLGHKTTNMQLTDFHRARVDVVAVQEIRWHGQGRIDKKHFSLFYSGPKERTGHYGTGFIINAKMRKSSFFLLSLLLTGCAN